MANARHPPAQRRSTANLIIKEGFLFKKGGLIKSWSRRYFVLNRESLCYFKRELQAAQRREDGVQGLEPLGRIFLTDIVSIDTEGVEKKKAFVFALHTPKRAVLLQAANAEDKLNWAEAIRKAKEEDKEAERKDPFRRTLRRLAPGLKRVTLFKDPDKGVGCTIKNAAGHILVNRIIEDGPIAQTGVLRPDDELLDIHGTTVTGLPVSEVVAVIRAAPSEFLVTVRPITAAVRRDQERDMGKIIYSDIVLQATPTSSSASPSSSPKQQPQHLVANGSPLATRAAANKSTNSSPTHSADDLSPNTTYEDLGNYDDEDDGDVPPPLPPRTEDALILVDPPPVTASNPPALPPKPQGDEALLALEQGHKEKLALMQKSRSCDSVEERNRGALRPPPPLQRTPRVHVYEEVKPLLNYVDIDSIRS